MRGRRRRRPRPGAAAIAALVATAGLAVALVVAGRGGVDPGPGGAVAAAVEVTPTRPGPVPEVSARRLGRPGVVDLSHLPGRGAVIDFWASWCAPCRQELLDLDRVYRADRTGVAVIGVDVRDGGSAATRFLRANRVSFPMVDDPRGSVAAAFRVMGTPTIVVVDADRRIVARALGPAGADLLARLVAEAAH